nr:MAG TPA: NTP-PPase-like protein [Caudoviricetes sp.]
MTYRLYNADTLNRYAKDCHERAVAKGFWHVPHSVGHYLMLVVSELSEAVEADRIGKWARLDHDTIDTLQRIEGAPYAQEFLREVKDRVEDEIADAVIRLLDLLGWLLKTKRTTEILNENDLSKVYGILDTPRPGEELTLLLLRIVADTSGYWRLGLLREKGILYAIKSLEQLCDHLGIDLMTHIELKLKYNATRPALHGKKY